MTETITCPFSWGRYFFPSNPTFGGNQVRAGYELNAAGSGQTRSIVKFDFSNLATIPENKILSVELNMYVDNFYGIGEMETDFHEVLKAATNQATWSTYNGSDSWSVGGCGDAGTDYYATPLGEKLWGSIGWGAVNLDLTTFKMVLANNHTMLLRPTSPDVSEEMQLVTFNNTTYPPYLEVTIRPGSSYIMMF